MSSLLRERIARGLAIAIAVAACIDPEVIATRVPHVTVAVVSVDSIRDAAFTERVARALAHKFQVTRAPFPGTGTTVLVGSALPQRAGELGTAIAAVIPHRPDRTIRLGGIEFDRAVPAGARTAVPVSARATGLAGARVRFTLSIDGVMVDQVDTTAAADDSTRRTDLQFVAGPRGSSVIRIAAQDASGSELDHVDAMVAIDATPQPVLFYDARASWQSTFVRRAIASDERLALSSRIVTSKGVSSDAGVVPQSLNDAAALDLFSCIVVGAPDALTDRDVTGLDGYLRRRAGTVILLLDQRGRGPYERLLDVTRWGDNGGRRIEEIAPVALTGRGLRAAELLWPEPLPPGGVSLGDVRTAEPGQPNHPIVWSAPVGAGTVIVNGALDAWRYRDSTQSGFDDFWRAVIGQAAISSPPAVRVTSVRSVVAPGDRVDVDVTVRDAMLHQVPTATSVVASLIDDSSAATTPIALWPSTSAGTLTGALRAPVQPGHYTISVTADGHHSSAPLLVSTDARPAPDDDPVFFADWVRHRGGRAVTSDALGDLPAAIHAVANAEKQREATHPFRSAWWLLPFVVLLSAEWWWRRRRGAA